MNGVFLFLSLLLLITPVTTNANGGDQRVLGNKYLVNLSRAPFTPTAGTKTAMTVSFVDLKTGKLIRGDILVTTRIGQGRGSKTYIHEENNILVKGGVLDWSYIFTNPGIHELFFNFAFASDPQTVYEPPDFLLDIQKYETNARGNKTILIAMASTLIGGLAGWIIGRKVKSAP